MELLKFKYHRILALLILSVVLAFAPFYLFAEPTQITSNCGIVQISAQITKSGNGKKYQLQGQGWLFKDAREVRKEKLYILTPAHVVFGAQSIQFSCPHLPLQSPILPQSFQLELMGISPTYDLAVLEISDRKFKGYSKSIVPLFVLNANNSISELKLPIDAPHSQTGSNLISSFIWVENNQYRTGSPGLVPGGWPKTYSILPYNNEITSLNGVRPGMSGALVVLVVKGYSNYIAGMVTKSLVNGPYSISIPLIEIIPKLPHLINKVDPRKIENKLSSALYVDFKLEETKSGKSSVNNRFRVLKYNLSDRTQLIGEEFCPINKFTAVSNWTEVGGPGGGTIADQSDGGTIADGSSFSTLEGLIPIEFTPAPTDLHRILGKSQLQRSAFFTDNRCGHQGIRWYIRDSESKILYGLKIKLNDQDVIVRIDTVADLFRLNWKDHGIGDIDSFLEYISTKGLFHEFNPESNQITNVSYQPFQNICSLSPNSISIYPPGSEDFNQAHLSQLGNTSGIKVLGFESTLFYKGAETRVFEDDQDLKYIEEKRFYSFLEADKNNKQTNFIGGYTCKKSSADLAPTLHLYSQSTVSDEKYAGYSYTLEAVVMNNLLHFVLRLANGKKSSSDQFHTYVLESDNIQLEPYWSQFADLKDGHKLELHFNPELKSLFFNLIINDKFVSNQLLSIKKQVYNDPNSEDKPLKLIRLLIKLK